MKPLVMTFLCCIAISPTMYAATARENMDDYVLTARGPHHAVWQRPVWEDTPFGKRAPHVQRYVEMQTGLSYLNRQTGQYEESDPSFVLARDGSAVASQTQHRVTIYPNLGAPDGAVQFQTPEGQLLRSSVIGLNLFDPATGKSLQIASARD